MIDRWSYDPRTKELDVWDSEGNRIQHFTRCGYDGYMNCAQGRIIDGHYSIYGNRPYDFLHEHGQDEAIRNEAKAVILERDPAAYFVTVF